MMYTFGFHLKSLFGGIDFGRTGIDCFFLVFRFDSDFKVYFCSNFCRNFCSDFLHIKILINPVSIDAFLAVLQCHIKSIKFCLESIYIDYCEKKGL